MEEFDAVLGRWSFVAQVLGADRPFLGPLFTWAAAAPKFGVLVLPPLVAMAIAWLKRALQRRRAVGSREVRSSEGIIFKTDACADRLTGSLGIGGWRCAGGVSMKEARWFSMTLTKADLPWAFSKEEDPQRVIAALEVLGSVLTVKYFTSDPRCDGGRSSRRPTSARYRISGLTDNKGNEQMTSKMLTTPYPSCAILMELAAQLEGRNLALDLVWSERSSSEEADALSNGDASLFAPGNRVSIDVKEEAWLVMDEMLQEGRSSRHTRNL